MNYGAGFSATYYAAILDPLSWTETDRVELISGSIKRSASDIRQTAELTVSDFDQSQEMWIRVYMDARQGEDIYHEALFTGLVEAPKREINGKAITRPLECYSVLKPLNDIVLQRGYYVDAGENGAAAIRRLLSTPAPVIIDEGAPNIEEYIVAESNETALSMIDRVLDSMGWRMKIHGDGTIEIGAKPTTPDITFSATGLDIVEKSLSVTRDWFACPNVFRATSGNLIAVARDDDPKSPLSTVSRGREVIMADDDVSLASDEGIAEYASRRLAEEQKVAESAEYSRRYVSDLNVGDMVELKYDEVEGTYTIDEQSIELTYGGRTTETVSRSVTGGTSEEQISPKTAWLLIKLPDGYYFVMPDGNRILVPYRNMIHD